MADQSGRRNGSPSQVTACRRCRKQKLRCSRETPSCRRCEDISAPCAYPPPPDRKLLAAQRAQNFKARALSATDEKTAELEHKPSPGQFSGEASPYSNVARGVLDNQPAYNFSFAAYPTRAASVDPPGGSAPTPAVLRQVPFPSKEMALLLVEVYFSRLYNANLLFHKPSLLADLESRSLPDFIFLSVFAIASLFLHKPPASIQGQAAELGVPLSSLLDCSKLAHDWASSASQQVLMHADQPRHETIQACQNLALFWFAVNQENRRHIHSHIAYRTARLLGYHLQTADKTEVDVLNSEIKRRLFWACWITNCISQENAMFKLKSWEEAIGLSFPSDEASFSIGNPKSKEKFHDQGHIVLVSHDAAGITEPSVMGEMVKLYGIWWEIQRFTKKYATASSTTDGSSQNSTERFSTLQELDDRLETIQDNLHPDLKYSGGASSTSIKVDSNQLFSLHCIYHLCVCALHSSVVTVFSNIEPDPQMPKKVTRMSAEEAVEHSRLVVDLASAYVTAGSDKSRLPSMIGYAMFVASTIQFKSLGAQGKLRDHSLARLHPAISILDELKEYWRPLVGLWKELGALFRTVGADINHLSKASLSAGVADTATDIDQIVKHPVLPDSSSGGSIYTYIEKLDINPPSSRWPSAGHSHGPAASSSLTASSAGSKGKKLSLPSRSLHNGPFRLPLPVQQGTQIYHGQQRTLSAVPSPMVGVPENYRMSASIPSNYISIENTVGGGRGGATEYSSIMEGMTSTVESTMVTAGDGMHDNAPALWWENSFEDFPSEQYGALTGPYHAGQENRYY